MNSINLERPYQPGDYFVVHPRGFLAEFIQFIQHLYSKDHESQYTHAGIIIDSDGATFEALGRTKRNHIDHYTGRPIMIVRDKLMTPRDFEISFAEISKMEGWIYPFFRLFLHLFGLARYIHWEFAVCSELVAKFQWTLGWRCRWWGVTPDNLADEWYECPARYEILKEGRK